MKKLLSALLMLALSFNLYAHCGSCGVGGSSDDHAEKEDKAHHEKDARYEEARERKEEMLEESVDGDSNDDE